MVLFNSANVTYTWFMFALALYKVHCLSAYQREHICRCRLFTNWCQRKWYLYTLSLFFIKF